MLRLTFLISRFLRMYTRIQWHNHMHLKLAHGEILIYTICWVFSIHSKYCIFWWMNSLLIDINVLLIVRLLSCFYKRTNGGAHTQKIPAHTHKTIKSFFDCTGATVRSQKSFIYNFNSDDQLFLSIISVCVRKFLNS